MWALILKINSKSKEDCHIFYEFSDLFPDFISEKIIKKKLGKITKKCDKISAF
jgi:hypothetical protein